MLVAFTVLRNNHDRSLPECSLHLCRIEDGHLAIILTWRKLIKANAETERHSSQPAGRPRRHRHGLCFKYLRLPLIKTYKSDERFGGSVLLVSLKIDIKIAAFAEDSCHAGN